MNKLFKVLLVIISSIIMILSLAFIVIEGRLLFSGDWLVYDSPLFGCIRYLGRLLLSVFVFIKCLLEIIYINKEHKVKEYLGYADIGLVIMSVVILIFSTNYVGLICIILSMINLIFKLLNIKLNNMNKVEG